MKLKKALITGVTGQDGSYLAEFLLEKGYEVHGMRRIASDFNCQRINHLLTKNQKANENFFLHCGDVTDSTTMIALIQSIQPDEIYNLAAQSQVKASFENALYTADTNALGPIRILEALRMSGLGQKVKFYQASTSEMFGKTKESPQTENTTFDPVSPYACSKLYAHRMTVNYRETYGFFACCGILFNHESPRRGENFVTRKITKGVSKIALKQQKTLTLGNLDSKRDWGYSPEYIKAMWLMLQQEKPEEFVIATGENHTVREFVERAFEEVGITIEWHGKGRNEKGFRRGTDDVIVQIDPSLFRPAEVDYLLGNSKKAKEKLGWEASVKFDDLVKIMVKHDYEKLYNNRFL